MLKNEAFKEIYESLHLEFELIEQFLKARLKSQMTQAELARKLNITESAISRLEGGGYAKASVAKLSQIADALGCSLKISLHAKKSNKAL